MSLRTVHRGLNVLIKDKLLESVFRTLENRPPTPHPPTNTSLVPPLLSAAGGRIEVKVQRYSGEFIASSRLKSLLGLLWIFRLRHRHPASPAARPHPAARPRNTLKIEAKVQRYNGEFIASSRLKSLSRFLFGLPAASPPPLQPARYAHTHRNKTEV